MQEETCLVIWWSTNTRAASVLLAIADYNNVPISLIVDPEVPPPPQTLLDMHPYAMRSRMALSHVDLCEILKWSRLETGCGECVIAPTSEYIQASIAGFGNAALDGLLRVPSSRIDYLEISNKLKLTEREFVGDEFPVAQVANSRDLKLPFVAKPKENVVNDCTLKPYIVNSPASLRKFRSEMDTFFPQKYVGAPSKYWCGFRSSSGQITSYWQENLLQAQGGGSIAYSRYLAPGNHPSIETHVSSLLERLNYVGPIMFEFRGDPAVCVEINPRFWGPLLLDIQNNAQVTRAFFIEYFSLNIQVPEWICGSNWYVVPSLLTKAIEPGSELEEPSSPAYFIPEEQALRMATTLVAKLGGDW